MDFNKILHGGGGGYCRKTNLNINFKHDRTKDDVTVTSQIFQITKKSGFLLKINLFFEV